MLSPSEYDRESNSDRLPSCTPPLFPPQEASIAAPASAAAKKIFFIVVFTMFDVSFILSPSHAQRQCKPGAEANLSGSAEAPPIKARAYSPQRYKNFVNEMIPSNYFGEIPAAGRSGRGTGGAGRTVNAAATGSYTCRGRRVRSRNRASHWEPRPVPCRPRRRRLPTKASRR